MADTIGANFVQRFAVEWVRPDMGRAIRSTATLSVPVALATIGLLPWEPTLVIISAHTMSNVDIRGPYRVRIAFLLTMALVMLGATALGSLAAGNPVLQLVTTAIIAVNAGLWRHLTPEYGPSLGAPITLIFLMASFFPPAHGAHEAAALAGMGWALLMQIAFWPIFPQHPLRRAVAESWTAVGQLLDVLAQHDPREWSSAVVTREGELRATLDNTYQTLDAARSTAPWTLALRALHLTAGKIGTRVTALQSTIECVRDEHPRQHLLPSYRAAMEALAMLCKSIALTTISRQPAHLTMTDVRLRRALSLLSVMRSSGQAMASSEPHASAHVVAIAEMLNEQLRAAQEQLLQLTERAEERAAFPMELTDPQASPAQRHPLLAAVLNLRARVDPVLLRFTTRLAVLLVTGVGMTLVLSQWFAIPHAYWLPFTMLVVSQPDFGATRRRAAERLGGTLVGSVLASVLLFLHLPKPVLLVGIAVMAFWFSFYLRRKYGVAVVFLTVMVVLLTEMHEPPRIETTLERVGSTVLGGAMALGAALVFWPRWERDRNPAIVAAALEANRRFLLAVTDRLAEGGGYGPAEIAAKQAAEKANVAAFSSLTRLYADPAHRRGDVEQAAAIVNGNQRVTRLLTSLLLEASPTSPPMTRPELKLFTDQAAALLSELADAALHRRVLPTAGMRERPAVTGARDRVVLVLARAAAELEAMRVSATHA